MTFLSKQERIVLAERPHGLVDNQTLRREVCAVSWPPVAPRGGVYVLVRVEYVGVEPAMRGWMSPDMNSYIPPVQLGSVMRAHGVGRVVDVCKSSVAVGGDDECPSLQVGDVVEGMLGMQAYAVLPAGKVSLVRQLPKSMPDRSTLALSVLGITGSTAYFGLFGVGKPVSTDTVLVSAAAGAVGGTVCELAAKVVGCKRVIGIAGGKTKCEMVVRELGASACIDYKGLSERQLHEAIKQYCPDGVDIFFDNVGGITLNAALRSLNRVAVICGAISTYNNTKMEPKDAPSQYMMLLKRRARMEGFVVFDFESEYERARRDLSAWIDQGLIHVREHTIHGLDRAPEALNMLFSGANQGKLIIKVNHDQFARL
ncbi:putative NADP-dependent oxidoreductase YfmJ [Porphyridium purpureum]|uniref:Putative NADP-dependent oxidoreductase YfmJ n=1 Tax=Porphyridium purpureum TaxID=35688 RepID=A0A5J4Z3Q5_PORPP|nr:putative NADP-dependent oxidoreductase YfmJ [Porphyridium purpureum]|eukprot:POR7385..scf208_2